MRLLGLGEPCRQSCSVRISQSHQDQLFLRALNGKKEDTNYVVLWLEALLMSASDGEKC